jgi:hypothetical protein
MKSWKALRKDMARSPNSRRRCSAPFRKYADARGKILTDAKRSSANSHFARQTRGMETGTHSAPFLNERLRWSAAHIKGAAK